eukprot:g67842.t1
MPPKKKSTPTEAQVPTGAPTEEVEPNDPSTPEAKRPLHEDPGAQEAVEISNALDGCKVPDQCTRDPSNPNDHSFGSVFSEVLNDGFLIFARHAGRAAGGVLQLQGGGRAEGRRGGRGVL